jgi:putative heme-binding domain-containing protein
MDSHERSRTAQSHGSLLSIHDGIAAPAFFQPRGSAELRSAVSQVSGLHVSDQLGASVKPNAQPITDRRYGRPETGATRAVVHGKILGIVLALVLATNLAQAQEQTGTNQFFLPKNPVAAAYVLGRLSNKELTAAPRSEFVYAALLQRKGLERKYRNEALDGLAKIRNSNRLTELLKGMIEFDKKGEESASVLQELSSLLFQLKPEELAAKRAQLERLAADSQFVLTRQIAYASLVIADGTIDMVWKKAEADSNALSNVLLSILLIRDPKLRADFHERVKPLVHQPDPVEVQRAAITALAAIPGHEAESFSTLSALAMAGTERAAAIASLQRIPKKFWPKEEAEPLVRNIMASLEKVPLAERTEPEFISAIQFATELATLVSLETAAKINQSLRGLGPVIVVIRAIYEQMLYDKQLIVVEPGKTVEIILENEDAMPHNLVIAAPGSVEELGVAAEKMSPEPDAQGRLYVPNSPKVLHASKMVDPGQKTKLSFAAPEQPGEYPYLCTFPGHWRRMVGVLAVTADVDAYLAKHAANEPKITEWKMEDFSADLTQPLTGHRLQPGKETFTKLGCAQCHKLGKDGNSYGPDLTETFKKWKGDRASVLQQIIEPSKVIEDRYKTYEIVLKDGDSVFGMIARDEADNVVLQTGPADNLVQVIKKSDIASRKPQSYSVMPAGLVNTLSKEQVLDLLTYIEAGGAMAKDHEHP